MAKISFREQSNSEKLPCLCGGFFWFPLSNCFVNEMISTSFWSSQLYYIFYLPPNLMVRIKLHLQTILKNKNPLQLDILIPKLTNVVNHIIVFADITHFIIIPKLSPKLHIKVIHCKPLSSHLQSLTVGCHMDTVLISVSTCDFLWLMKCEMIWQNDLRAIILFHSDLLVRNQEWM